MAIVYVIIAMIQETTAIVYMIIAKIKETKWPPVPALVSYPVYKRYLAPHIKIYVTQKNLIPIFNLKLNIELP